MIPNTVNSILKQYWVWFVAAMIPVVLFLSFYPHYLRNNTFFWICLLTLPFSVQSSGKQKGNHIFWLGTVISGLSLLLPTVTAIYIVLCLTLILLIQSVVGKLHYTLIVHAILASPLFGYFSSLISFPLRLQLSSIVAFLLQKIGQPIQIEGNLVLLGDNSFLVDEACAGMYMLGYGLLFGTIILSLSTKSGTLTLKSLIVYYITLFTLIMLGNIVRITLLILFHIMPDHWFHEVLGLFLYIFQILIPFYLIVQWGTKRLAIKDLKIGQYACVFPKGKYALMCCFIVLLIGRQHFEIESNETSDQNINFPGYSSLVIKDKVTKLQNEEALIYIKPPVSTFRSDHNPMICWRGSGYSFKKIEKWPIKNISVNHAELVKGEDKIYTAWWFESNTFKTGDQLAWRRYGFLNNEDFYLINITCNTKQELAHQLEVLLEYNILSSTQTISTL